LRADYVHIANAREYQMARVAFMTFGVLHEPRAHLRSKGFIDRIPANYEMAERSEGFVDRSHLDPDTDRHSWGELVCPRFLPDELHPNVARTLTLWQSLESVCAFSYSGLHAEALGLRKEWFRKTEFPSYVIWWVADDHVPTFIDSTARLERLYTNGPCPDAFNFKRSFDREGNPMAIDPLLVREIATRNAKVV
jgi:Domain of unknown function (DUF3291)